MGYGQGSAMALPIYGLFMKKVLADKSLPYDPNAKFEFPTDISLCTKEYFGGTGYTSDPGYSSGSGSESDVAEEESIEGIFD